MGTFYGKRADSHSIGDFLDVTLVAGYMYGSTPRAPGLTWEGSPFRRSPLRAPLRKSILVAQLGYTKPTTKSSIASLELSSIMMHSGSELQGCYYLVPDKKVDH